MRHHFKVPNVAESCLGTTTTDGTSTSLELEDALCIVTRDDPVTKLVKCTFVTNELDFLVKPVTRQSAFQLQKVKHSKKLRVYDGYSGNPFFQAEQLIFRLIQFPVDNNPENRFLLTLKMVLSRLMLVTLISNFVKLMAWTCNGSEGSNLTWLWC